LEVDIVAFGYSLTLSDIFNYESAWSLILIFEIIILLQLYISIFIHYGVTDEVGTLDIPNNIVEFMLMEL
jgi:hypothetical protein